MVVSAQRADTDYLSQCIGERSTVHASDIAAVLTARPEVIGEVLALGYSVQ